jgi:hypothetical protein
MHDHCIHLSVGIVNPTPSTPLWLHPLPSSFLLCLLLYLLLYLPLYPCLRFTCPRSTYSSSTSHPSKPMLQTTNIYLQTKHRQNNNPVPIFPTVLNVKWLPSDPHILQNTVSWLSSLPRTVSHENDPILIFYSKHHGNNFHGSNCN